MWSIFRHNLVFADRPAIITSRGTTNWQQMVQLADQAVVKFTTLRQRRVGVVCDASPQCFAALAALDHLDANVFLLDANKASSEVGQITETFQLHAVIRIEVDDPWKVTVTDQQADGRENPTVTILTSGTTGQPKAARHSWQTLCRPVAALRDRSAGNTNEHPTNDRRWLLTYRPQLYAGLQVVLHAFANGGTLVVPDEDFDQNETVQLMESSRVQCVSATPSFWRGMLLHVDRERLKSLSVQQITLGGELVDQALLTSLSSIFPEARIAHIYATTELGKCFSITDRMAGFPTSMLNSVQPGHVELKVESGRLFVRSHNAMLEYDPRGSHLPSAAKGMTGDWFDTGDLVEIEGDRVLFVGRDSEIINVGGYKVNPTKIEQLLRTVDGVANIRVYGRASSVTGQIVACDVVLADGFDEQTVFQAIRAAATGHLDRYHLPRLLQTVDQIETTSAGKVQRRSN